MSYACAVVLTPLSLSFPELQRVLRSLSSRARTDTRPSIASSHQFLPVSHLSDHGRQVQRDIMTIAGILWKPRADGMNYFQEGTYTLAERILDQNNTSNRPLLK